MRASGTTLIALAGQLLASAEPVLSADPFVGAADAPAVVTTVPLMTPTTPIEINTDGGGTLPLLADPTIGRGQALGPPTKAPAMRTELPEPRTEHSRTFLNPDGTYSMEAIQGRMNYLAADGTWQPMDLGLVAAPEGPYDLHAKASDRVVAGLASISVAGHTLAPRAIGYGTAGDRAADADRLTYAATEAVGSLFAVPTDAGFESGVTIDTADQASTYRFALDAGDLTVELAPDGQTILLVSHAEDKPTVIGASTPPCSSIRMAARA